MKASVSASAAVRAEPTATEAGRPAWVWLRDTDGHATAMAAELACRCVSRATRRSCSRRRRCHRLICQRHGQGRRRRGDAAAHQESAQLVQRAVHAPPRGVFAHAEDGGDLGERAPFEKAQQHGRAIGVGEPVHRIVQHRTQAVPIGRGSGRSGQFMQGMGLSFAGVAAARGADKIDGHVAGRGTKPCGQHDAARKRTRAARKGDKHVLRDVRCRVRVSTEPALRRRVDQIEMAPHQFGEGGFGAFFGVASEQFGVVNHKRCSSPSRRSAENRTGICTVSHIEARPIGNVIRYKQDQVSGCRKTQAD